MSSLYGKIGKPMGLVDKIRSAQTATEVQTYLNEGGNYTLASKKTSRRWQYAASRRLKQLQQEAEQPAKAEKVEKPVKAPKAKKQKA